MFCSNCGSKTWEDSKFCHHCGAKVSADLAKPKDLKKDEKISKTNVFTDNARETVEEYQKRTNIKSKEEAKKYLNQLRVLFWIVFLSIVVIRGLSGVSVELAAILSIPYIGLLIYFIIFSVKILKAEKLSGANAFFCVFFAPFSWLYIYPLMADPLKIILGEKKPPLRLTEAEKNKKARIKKIGINFGIIIVVLLVALLTFVLLV